MAKYANSIFEVDKKEELLQMFDIVKKAFFFDRDAIDDFIFSANAFRTGEKNIKIFGISDMYKNMVGFAYYKLMTTSQSDLLFLTSSLNRTASSDEALKTAHLTWLAVDPDKKNPENRYGTNLFQESFKNIQESNGISLVTVSSYPSSVGFYEKNGFRHSYFNNNEPAVVSGYYRLYKGV